MDLSAENSETQSLRESVVALCQLSPAPQRFSNARLTTVVYLADWKSALDPGQQITNIQWGFHHY